jgi:hypothetical protein
LIALVLVACSTTRPARSGGTAGEAAASQPAAPARGSASDTTRSTEGTTPAPSPRASSVTCSDPRPEICTQQYQPVCAQVDTGVRCIKAPCPSAESRTFPNGCAACTDPKVLGYVEGACRGAPGSAGAAPEDVH